MAEYIEFEATKQAIDRIRSVYHRARNFNAVSAIDNVFGEIKEIPAADVAPVIHAHWIRRDESFTRFKCSNPKCSAENFSGFENYCPNCGAKMDEGKGDFIER